MFNYKSEDGKKNVCGRNIAEFRKSENYSQRALAEKMQLEGVNVDKNSIQRLESGQRFVTDIEVIAFAKIFNKSLEEILGINQD